MRDRTTFPPHLPSLRSHLPTPSHRRHHRFLHTPHHHHRHTFPPTFLQALTVEWSVPSVAWHSTRTSSRDMPPTVVTAREHLQRKKCWVFLEWCIVSHKSGANHEESISCENIYFVRICPSTHSYQCHLIMGSKYSLSTVHRIFLLSWDLVQYTNNPILNSLS